MKPSSPYLNREEQAMREVGQTTIRPPVAWVLVTVFLAVIYAVPLIQQVHDVRAHLAGARGRPDSPRGRDYDIFRRLPAAFAVLVHTPGSPTANSPLARVFAANRQFLQDIHSFEDALEDEAIVNQRVRPPVQYVLSRWLGAGNEKAYCGVQPWLFYRADIDYLTGLGFLNPVQLGRRAGSGNEWTSAPQPDPRPAILDFQRQLAQRGIQLIVMPVPPKSAIQPEKFSSRFEAGAVRLENSSYAAFIRDLKQAGVKVADVAPQLALAPDTGATDASQLRGSVDAVRKNRQDLPFSLAWAKRFGGAWRTATTPKDGFLATDTHWRPEAMELAARNLKQYVERNVQLPPHPGEGYRAQAAGITNRGDLAVMLRLPIWACGYPPETVGLRQILTARGEYWSPDETSDVLVLGDSFSNIYSLDAMGWGESAGLIEQLSFELQRPLDRLVINDNGAYATRALLARELAHGRDPLAGKRLVIWQFAMRELVAGDWKNVPLTIGKPVPARFFVPATGMTVVVRGTLRAVSPVPRPGTVPYKDHIAAAHIVDLECGEQAIRGNQALVYLVSMWDNVWTPAARLRPGDPVMLLLRPWVDVASRYERINRTELSDAALQFAEPCWGELKQ